MYISWPFYSADLKNVVRQLKAKGKLRDKPLREMDKIAISLFFCLAVFLMFPPSDISFGQRQLDSRMLSVVIILSALKLTINAITNKKILPYTRGRIFEAHVVSPVEYGSYLPGWGGGWFFSYLIQEGQITDRVSKMNPLPKKMPEIANIEKGSRITVLLDSEKNSCPFFPSLENFYSLTTDPVTSRAGGKP